MTLLIDSAVYIDAFRGGVDLMQHLLPVLRAGALYNCGVVRAEVVRGIKSLKLKADMERFFDITPEVPTDARLWRTVSELGWTLGRAGKWPPVTDLVIAASAMRIRATLISLDAHFLDVPGLLLRGELPEL